VVTQVDIRTSGQGLFEITDRIQDVVSSAGVREGLCTVMIQHTSASLTIQENADPSARRDLEDWLNQLVPEGGSHFTHTQEGPDDMPSHIKAALTATTLSIPIRGDRLALGTWQGSLCGNTGGGVRHVTAWFMWLSEEPLAGDGSEHEAHERRTTPERWC
jgi:secondary thiamine-phosphate synthase enzyme